VRHRVYVPEMGRWTRRDPIGYVDGVGLYEYVGGAPTRRNDPSGLIAMSSDCASCGGSNKQLDKPDPRYYRSDSIGPSIFTYPPADPRSNIDCNTACAAWARRIIMTQFQLTPRDVCWEAALKAARDCCRSDCSSFEWWRNGAASCINSARNARASCMFDQAKPPPGTCYAACEAAGTTYCSSVYNACLMIATLAYAACVAGSLGFGFVPCTIAYGEMLVVCNAWYGGCLIRTTLVCLSECAWNR